MNFSCKSRSDHRNSHLTLELVINHCTKNNIGVRIDHFINCFRRCIYFMQSEIETSAKQRINVDEAFFALVKEIRAYNKVCSAISAASIDN